MRDAYSGPSEEVLLLVAAAVEPRGEALAAVRCRVVASGCPVVFQCQWCCRAGLTGVLVAGDRDGVSVSVPVFGPLLVPVSSPVVSILQNVLRSGPGRRRSSLKEGGLGAAGVGRTQVGEHHCRNPEPRWANY
jgi:hypothetical protein